ncbi:hypothetical protein [Microbacterium sp. MMO-10]|uniref:hypothetical protein n=1 Tax=Microbacterium sp. MMO-10 TaxID=3081272 RepID=UPI003015CF61
MNRIVKRALWGTLLAGGITLAGATAANAAEAPPNGADCGCNVVKSALTTVTNLLTAPCDQPSGGQPGSGGTEGSGGLPAVTQDVSALVTDTLATATSAVPGGSTGGGTPGGGTDPSLPSAPVDTVLDTVTGVADTATSEVANTVSGVTGGLPDLPSVPGLPGTGAPGGGTGSPGVVTIPVPGVGTVHAGATPDGLDVGKNLNVLGIKDDWDLTAGRNGIATTDRIGTDSTNVYVDAAVPTTGTTAPHASVTLPNLGGLTGGGLPGVPGLPSVPGLPGGSIPGLPSLPIGDLTGALGGLTGSLPGLPSVPGLPGGSIPGLPGTGGTSGVITIPVPGVGSVHAGTTPDGLNVGKNLNVLGIKDDWDLTAGRNGIATTDRIGTDTTNVYVDAAVPTTGTTAPHASVTLPNLGGPTGGGNGGGTFPGLPALPLGDLTGALGGLTGSLPGLPGNGGTPGGNGGGTVPGLPALPLGDLTGALGGLTGPLSGLTGGLPGLPTLPGLPGTGGTPSTGVITVPIPGVGSVHAGTTPDGLNVGKNLNVLGIKDVWDLTAGPKGISTTDRIGTDSTNVYVDAAVPTTGATAPHAAVTLPSLGNLTGGLPTVPGLPGTGNPGTPGTGGTLPGLPNLGGILGGLTGGLPGLPTVPGTPGTGGTLPGLPNLGGILGGLTGGLPGLPTIPGLPGTGNPGTPGTGGTLPGLPNVGGILGGLTGSLPGLPTVPGTPGTGGTLPSLPSLPIGDLGGIVGGVTGALPAALGVAGEITGSAPGAIGGITGSLPGVIGGVIGGITGSLPGLPTAPGTPGTGTPGTPGTGTGTPGSGIGGTAPGAGTGGVPIVSTVAHSLVGAAHSLYASTPRNGSLAQTGFSDPFLLFAGLILLAAGAVTKAFERP